MASLFFVRLLRFTAVAAHIWWFNGVHTQPIYLKLNGSPVSITTNAIFDSGCSITILDAALFQFRIVFQEYVNNRHRVYTNVITYDAGTAELSYVANTAQLVTPVSDTDDNYFPNLASAEALAESETKSFMVVFDERHNATEEYSLVLSAIVTGKAIGVSAHTNAIEPQIELFFVAFGEEDVYVIFATIDASAGGTFVSIVEHSGGEPSSFIGPGIPQFTWTGEWNTRAPSVEMANPRMAQSVADPRLWVFVYDVNHTALYGETLFWAHNGGDRPQPIDYDPSSVTNLTTCRNDLCSIHVQDIVPANKICSADINIWTAFMVLFRSDYLLQLELIHVSVDATTNTTVLSKGWNDAFTIIPVFDADADRDFATLEVLTDSPYISTLSAAGTEHYLLSYINTDGEPAMASFSISGCTVSPIITPSNVVEELVPIPSVSLTHNYSHLCTFHDYGIVLIGYFEQQLTPNSEEFAFYIQPVRYSDFVTGFPSTQPTFQPSLTTGAPSADPSANPSANPSSAPPSADPTSMPSTTADPTADPTRMPTVMAIATTDSAKINATADDPLMDAADALAEGLSTQVSDPILTVMIAVLCVLAAITILAWMHNWRSSWFPCFYYTDDARVGSLLAYSLQVWDFISDIYFALSMANILTADVLESHPDAYSSILSLALLSGVFIVVPWTINLFWLVCQRWRWTKHSIVNAWVRDHAWFLFLLCVISGGADSVIRLCNSRIFALPVFSMELPRHEYIRQARWATLAVTLFENIPQIAIQGAFLSYYTLLTNGCVLYSTSAEVSGCKSVFQSLIFAGLSSIFSLIMAIGICLLQCSDPLDDKRFQIHVNLDARESEDSVRLQLGLRRKIGRAIANALEMHDSVIRVEAVKWGYNKLLFIVSVTDSHETIEDLSNKRGNIMKHIANGGSYNLKDELEDEHYDKLLTKFLRAKNNGQLAGSLMKVLKLEHMPEIENVSIPDRDDLPDLKSIYNRVKRGSGQSGPSGSKHKDNNKSLENHNSSEILIHVDSGHASHKPQVVSQMSSDYDEYDGDDNGHKHKFSFNSDAHSSRNASVNHNHNLNHDNNNMMAVAGDGHLMPNTGQSLIPRVPPPIGSNSVMLPNSGSNRNLNMNPNAIANMVQPQPLMNSSMQMAMLTQMHLQNSQMQIKQLQLQLEKEKVEFEKEKIQFSKQQLLQQNNNHAMAAEPNLYKKKSPLQMEGVNDENKIDIDTDIAGYNDAPGTDAVVQRQPRKDTTDTVGRQENVDVILDENEMDVENIEIEAEDKQLRQKTAGHQNNNALPLAAKPIQEVNNSIYNDDEIEDENNNNNGNGNLVDYANGDIVIDDELMGEHSTANGMIMAAFDDENAHDIDGDIDVELETIQ